MSDLTETHRSFVNTWECDENAHMNVQFYMKRFDEAARFFDMLSADASCDRPLPHDRHVRYHAELRAGSTTVTRSAAIAGGTHDGRVVHFLEHAETGALSATALDFASRLNHRHTIGEDDARLALPRSAPAAPLEPITMDGILARGGLATNRSIVAPGECGPDGLMSQQFYIARLSDAAPHAWKVAGVDVEWLREHKLGRVAVEMKITHHAPARAGDALTVFSTSSAYGGKTVTLRHEIVRMADGMPLASGEVVALILDLDTRRATRLPQEVMAQMARNATMEG